MKKYSLTHLALFIIILVIASCKNNIDRTIPKPISNLPELVTDIPLDTNLGRWLDSLTPVSVREDYMTFPDGRNVVKFLQKYSPEFADSVLHGGRIGSDLVQPPRIQLDIFNGGMQVSARRLCDQSLYSYGDDGVGRPSQDGLWYVCGSKDLTIRRAQQRSDGTGKPIIWCKDKIRYGLDCSGFIYQAAKRAQIVFTSAQNPSAPPSLFCGVSFLSDIQNWNSAFGSSNLFKAITIENKGFLPVNQLQHGDIIVWPSHIACIYLYRGDLTLFQSNGPWDDSQCERLGPQNKPYPRGSHSSKLTFDEVKHYGLKYVILRPVATDYNCGIVIDADGNQYNTVKIGEQCWTVENLRTTKYQDGMTINSGLDNNAWTSAISGAYIGIRPMPLPRTETKKLSSESKPNSHLPQTRTLTNFAYNVIQCIK